MRTFFHKMGLVAVSLLACVALSQAASLSFSTGAAFETGYRLINGSDLNVMVDAINNLDSTVGADPALIGSGVNKVSIASGATTVVPVITVGGASADTNIGIQVAGKGTGVTVLGGSTTCTGTTTATCNAQRFTVSITGLTTTAGGNTSAAMVVSNTSVASSSVHVICQVNGYSGTGQPIATAVVPGTNQVSVSVTNVAASGSLNATVPIFCQVLG